MKKLNIKYEIIKNIIQSVNDKQDSINFDGVFFLETPIDIQGGKIFYFSRRKLYLNDGIELKWVEQKGDVLKKIFYQIKNNNFYFYLNNKKNKFELNGEYKRV